MGCSRRAMVSTLGLGCLLALAFALPVRPAFAAYSMLVPNGAASHTSTGTIDTVANPWDQRIVYLYPGEAIEVEVHSPTIAIELFSPQVGFTAAGVAVPAVPALASRPAGGADPLMFSSAAGGYFSLRVTSTAAHDIYSLDTTITRPATYMQISPISQTVAYSGLAPVAGRVYNIRDQNGTVNPARGTVTLSWSTDGTVFWPYAQQSLAGDGSFAFSPAQNIFLKTWWNVVFEGGDAFGPTAGTKIVTTHARLTDPVAKRTKLRTYRLQGTLEPLQTVGSFPVRIYLQRRVNGKWKAMGSVRAKASDNANQTASVYSATYRFANSGAWRLQAYFAGTPQILATRGVWVPITVK